MPNLLCSTLSAYLSWSPRAESSSHMIPRCTGEGGKSKEGRSVERRQCP